MITGNIRNVINRSDKNVNIVVQLFATTYSNIANIREALDVAGSIVITGDCLELDKVSSPRSFRFNVHSIVGGKYILKSKQKLYVELGASATDDIVFCKEVCEEEFNSLCCFHGKSRNLSGYLDYAQAQGLIKSLGLSSIAGYRAYALANPTSGLPLHPMIC